MRIDKKKATHPCNCILSIAVRRQIVRTGLLCLEVSE